jgi:hypothetical protein
MQVAIEPHMTAQDTLARRIPPISLSEADAAALDAFAADVKAASISCANLLSCFNAASLTKALRLPVGIAKFAPVALRPAPAVASGPLSGLFSPAAKAGLKGFDLFLVHGREELEQILTLHQRDGAVRKADVAKAGDVLSTAACFAKITLRDLVAIYARLFRDFDVAEMNYLAGLLDEVLQGKSPLLAEGRLTPVRTDFLIRERRVELTAEAMLIRTHEVEHVVVCNISQGGLGFEGPSRFEMGQMVEIKLLASGRSLEGRLAWRIGNRAGVAFARSLEETDPLLTV